MLGASLQKLAIVTINFIKIKINPIVHGLIPAPGGGAVQHCIFAIPTRAFCMLRVPTLNLKPDVGCHKPQKRFIQH